MLHRGGLEVYANNDYQFCSAHLYNGTAWVTVVPYVYVSNAWVKAGAAGTILEQFITSNNQDFYTSNNEPFLVRKI